MPSSPNYFTIEGQPSVRYWSYSTALEVARTRARRQGKATLDVLEWEHSALLGTPVATVRGTLREAKGPGVPAKPPAGFVFLLPDRTSPGGYALEGELMTKQRVLARLGYFTSDAGLRVASFGLDQPTVDCTEELLQEWAELGHGDGTSPLERAYGLGLRPTEGRLAPASLRDDT